jgi:molybdopterin-guanine dinucleotide biosynthesis protein A
VPARAFPAHDGGAWNARMAHPAALCEQAVPVHTQSMPRKLQSETGQRFAHRGEWREQRELAQPVAEEMSLESSALTRPTTGIILAGGRSRRMGRDKAALPFGDLPLLAWMVQRVGKVCRPVIVVAREAGAYRDCGATVIADGWPGEGPLVGLHAGLMATATEYAAAVACDLPLVEPALLAALIDRAPGWSAVVPEALGNVHPICAIYKRSVGQHAEALLRRGGGSLRQLLADPELRVRYLGEEELREWDPALRSFMNINTPDDYERAKRLTTAL